MCVHCKHIHLLSNSWTDGEVWNCVRCVGSNLNLNTKYTIIMCTTKMCHNIRYIHSFIPLACAECNDSLPFSGASSIPLCYELFPATLLHQLFFYPLSPHLAIYFLFYLSILLLPNSYIILFGKFYFLPFSVHVQTNIIYLTYCLYYSRFFNTCINFFIG